MKRRVGGIAASAAAIVCLMGMPAFAAGGTALGVKPQAEKTTGSATTTLTVGTDIQIGDVVRTGQYGQVQIKFDDDTRLVVGPSSSLVIEDYLLRADNSAGKLAINALSGTFRFATGNAAKDRYSIQTPTGTIGVRGTEFDFTVQNGQTQVLLYHGSVLICNLQDRCVTMAGACEVGQYDFSDSQLIGPSIKTEGELRDNLEAAFKYANSQTPLLREFWFSKARDCFNSPVVHEVPEALVTGEGKVLPPEEPPPTEEPPPPPDPDPEPEPEPEPDPCHQTPS